MPLISALRNALAIWFGWPIPTTPERSETTSEDDRRSIRDVTLEQLGIAHWSSHSHF
ncbi:hypothetical protein [Bosea sp. BH3]|uniref:hypothetical protein n=1 Tax=Bosea sp. BH3 TaxID=2871701 RepID=UPI0021CB0844|nr:hypothetical protein [Bosea sp. BH3]MCU4181450.1 hypothetical protein [Bosea sp. BH3]